MLGLVLQNLIFNVEERKMSEHPKTLQVHYMFI